MVTATFPPKKKAVSDARRFVRDTFRGWGAVEVIDDAVLLTSELVTNVVLHAGTPLEVVCQLADTAVRVEVVDKCPFRPVTDPVLPDGDTGVSRVTGRGMLMPLALANAWGVTYETETKTVWFRLDLGETPGDSRLSPPRQIVAHGTSPLAPVHPFDRVHPAELERAHKGWLSFLAEASDMLAGTLEEDMILSLAAQLVVPRLARWCAFYLADEVGTSRPFHVWHSDETRVDALRVLLDKASPPVGCAGVQEWDGLAELCHSGGDLAEGDAGHAVIVPLSARGRELGSLILGRADGAAFAQEVLWLVEDLGCRIGLGLDNARMYSRQREVGDALQRSLLPAEIPRIPGVEHGVVYEPAGESREVGGDFYDIFPVGEGRWRFAIGDVCGTGPEAAAVTGLARHALRLLARESLGLADGLHRLNQAILDEEPRARLMTVLYGELAPRPAGGVGLTLVSAGHPLPLRLAPGGEVRPLASPQLLLGAVEDPEFIEEPAELAPGDVLLAVTDGVTERRHEGRLLDDHDGLAQLLATCAGLTAAAVAARLRTAVIRFAPDPPDDDLALLVFRAL